MARWGNGGGRPAVGRIPLRVALTVFVLVAALPGTGLAIAREQRAVEDARDRIMHEAGDSVAYVSQRVGALFDRTRMALLLLARQPEVVAAASGRDSTCSQELAEALDATQEIVNLGVATSDGDVHCSGVPLPHPVNVADRVYFHDATSTGHFAVGVHQTGRITTRRSLNVAVPVHEAGSVIGVLFAALDLAAIEDAALLERHVAGTAVFDRNGATLASRGQLSGTAPPISLEALWARHRIGSDAFDDGDGFVYATSRVEVDASNGPTDVLAAVAVDGQRLDALEAQFRRDIVLLTLTCLAVVAVLLVAARRHLVSPLAQLVEATSQVGSGQFPPGLVSQRGSREVASLSVAFSHMATALEDRSRALRRERNLFETVLDSLSEGLVAYDRALQPVVQNRSLRDIAGRAGSPPAPAFSLDAVSSDGTTWRQMLNEAFDGRPGRALEFHLSPDGQSVVVLATATLVHDPHAGSDIVVVVLEDVSGYRAVEKELDRQSRHDHLTGLPNRRELERWLAELLPEVPGKIAGASVIFLDLRNFKLINDSLGHAAGDAVLVTVSERLTSAIRAPDLVARFGSDEFVVVCVGTSTDTAAARVCQRLLELFDEQFDLNGQQVDIRATVGCAVIDRHGMTVAETLASASTAVHHAKRQGATGPVFYRELQRQANTDRLALEVDLRKAMADEEIALHYQPVVSLTTAETVSFEALARWDHPIRGSIPPDEFIPIAEALNLTSALGRWALQTACAQLAQWRATPGTGPAIAVNISGSHLTSRQLQTDVHDALTLAGLPSDALVIEITESVLVDAPNAVAQLHRLRQTGVTIAIDDFGTGYSSLSYLTDLPIDVLKIDRSFVARLDEPRGRAMVAAMIRLSSELGFTTVAEGVETRAQVEILTDIGCDQAQGYYFGRPILPQDRR